MIEGHSFTKAGCQNGVFHFETLIFISTSRPAIKYVWNNCLLEKSLCLTHKVIKTTWGQFWQCTLSLELIFPSYPQRAIWWPCKQLITYDWTVRAFPTVQRFHFLSKTISTQELLCISTSATDIMWEALVGRGAEEFGSLCAPEISNLLCSGYPIEKQKW